VKPTEGKGAGGKGKGAKGKGAIGRGAIGSNREGSKRERSKRERSKREGSKREGSNREGSKREGSKRERGKRKGYRGQKLRCFGLLYGPLLSFWKKTQCRPQGSNPGTPLRLGVLPVICTKKISVLVLFIGGEGEQKSQIAKEEKMSAPKKITLYICKKFHSSLIGRGGEEVRRLSSTYNCKIDIPGEAGSIHSRKDDCCSHSANFSFP